MYIYICSIFAIFTDHTVPCHFTSYPFYTYHKCCIYYMLFKSVTLSIH